MVYRNRGGMVTLMLTFYVFFVLFAVITAGTALYGFKTLDNVASNITGITLGNITFEETYADTWGKGLDALISSVSIISFALVLGMVVVMLIVGFKLPKINKMWIILDIFIIIFAFIAAVYISIVFESIINSDPVFLDIYSTDLQKSSAFLLNLPFVIAIIGVMIIIITYISFKKKDPRVLEFN